MTNVATIENVNGRFRAMFDGKVLASSTDRDYVITAIRSGLNRKANLHNVRDVKFDDFPHDIGERGQPIGNPKVTFSVDERFEFLSNTVQMVIEGISPSLIISGAGGLGKTHMVLEEIKAAGLTFTTEYQKPIFEKNEDEEEDDEKPEWKNPGEVHVIKGYSSAKGLYRTLYENNGCLIVLDDCDSVQKDQNAINILKSALDSYDERWVHWNVESRGSDTLPKHFLFTGKIIFISNLSQDAIDQAIKSRCLRVDLTMSSSEKIERMRTVVNGKNFLPEYSMTLKLEALEMLNTYRDEATDLNIRTLITVCLIRAANKPNWDKLALYTITA